MESHDDDYFIYRHTGVSGWDTAVEKVRFHHGEEEEKTRRSIRRRMNE